MMKTVKKALCFGLACVMALSLLACGTKNDAVLDNAGKTENGKLVWYLGGNNVMAGDVDVKSLFEGVADTINPQVIYSKTTITENMLHGVYTLNNKEKDLETVRKDIPFQEVAFKSNTASVTILPTAVYFGADNLCCSLTNYKYDEFRQVKDYEVAVLELATADKIGQTPCIYEVNGNTITFKQIEMTSAENEPFTYELTGVEFHYTFEISGPYITFLKDGHSLKLKAYCLTKNIDSELSMNGYSLPDSPLIENIDYFASASAWNYAVRRDGSYVALSAYKLDDEGRFTAYFAEKDLVTGEKEVIIKQYAYILQSEGNNFLTSFSIVLLDENKTYYYTDDITQREARALEEQGVNVDKMTVDEIKEIAEIKKDLFDELQKEFEANGINAMVNRSTGEIALDATVLFGVDESAISEDGKAFLQKFMSVYTKVVFGEKYKDFISKIMIEGHTDTDGTYEHNQTLSQARADSVKEYCLSGECGVEDAYATSLRNILETIGYAYDKPVYDRNGEVDKAASRRVSFRFIVDTEKQE